MNPIISLAGVLFILSMINERIINFIKLQFSESKLLGITIGNLRERKKGGEEKDRDKRIIMLNFVIGTIVCLVLRADLISIISHLDKLSDGIGWKTFDVKNAVDWITLFPGAFLTGCFISLGSKFWHDLLDLLFYSKTLKGQLASSQEYHLSQKSDLLENKDALKNKDLQNLETSATAFKQEIIEIKNVTTAILNTEAAIPIMEVYINKDFDNNMLIPKRLFYLGEGNESKSIAVKVIPNFEATVQSDLWPSSNILNEVPYPHNRGSVGGVVYDKITNEAYFLSCYHVVKSISQRWDFTPPGFETVLEYKLNKPCGKIINAIRDDEIDAAIIRAIEDFNLHDAINGIGVTYATRDLNAEDKKFQTKVKIFGGITQLLKVGYVSDITIPVNIQYYKDNSTETEIHRLNKLILIRSIDADPFSQPGDSGSLVVDEYNYIIGMLVGGQGLLSFVIPINTVLQRLNIKVKPT